MSDAPENPIRPSPASPANPEPDPSASPGRNKSLRQRIQIGALVLLVLAIWLSYLYLVLLVVLPLASAWNGEQDKNEAVSLEIRANQAPLLCDLQHRCMKLMSRMGLEGAP